MGDGTRTRGHRGHNPVLYLLSYAHHGNVRILVVGEGEEQGEELTTDHRPQTTDRGKKSESKRFLELDPWNLEPST